MEDLERMNDLSGQGDWRNWVHPMVRLMIEREMKAQLERAIRELRRKKRR